MEHVSVNESRRTSGQTTALGDFQFHILHQLSGLAYRLLRALTMTGSSEEDYFDADKFIIEVEKRLAL